MDKIKLDNIRKVRATLRANSLDGLLVTSPENRRYLSGFTAEDVSINESSGALLILKKRLFLLTDGRYHVQAQKEAKGWEIVIYKKGISEALKTIRSEFPDTKRIGFEPTYLSFEQHELLKKNNPGLELVPIRGRIEKMRGIKTAWEVELIKKAISVAEEVLDSVSKELSPGVTEKEVAWRINEGLYKKSDGPSFPPIVASGPNSALPHAEPTDRTIKEGEPIIIDMGARVNGYCSDMTRTFFIGPPKPPFKEIYQIVRTAQKRAQQMLRAAIPGRECDRVARDIIRKNGYGEYFVHALGHGVGLAVHEQPALSPRWKKHLKEGMVVTIEPGIYIPGKGGVRLESMALVESTGCKILTSNVGYYNW